MRSVWKLLKRVSGLRRKADSRVPEPEPGFDGKWYLNEYPDVAAAGMDPWEHYWRFGKKEGRLPQGNRALVWDVHLWAGAHAVMVPRLQGLVSGSDASDATPSEMLAARWVLARWYAWEGDWSAVLDTLMPDISSFDESLAGAGPWLLCVEALCRLNREAADGYSGSSSRAQPVNGGLFRTYFATALHELQKRYPGHADTALAMVNAQPWVEEDCPSRRLGLLNEIWASRGLSAVDLNDSGLSEADRTQIAGMSSHSRAAPCFQMDNLVAARANPGRLDAGDGNRDAIIKTASVQHSSFDSTLVSVIVPLYNAARTIETAIRSLFEQTWRPIEIIVVDDGSKDDGAARVEAMKSRCPEGILLRVVQLPENVGAYAARNAGMAQARGVFLTTHDSDDWSHPDKIARQVHTLEQNPSAQACMSWWVRATEDLLFHRWRLNQYGWTYPNLSSLMIRKKVLEIVGFWDEVRVNADSEYWERLRVVWGDGSVVLTDPEVPLSIGRADEGSLSQHRDTHLVSEFNGVRKDYMQSARRWHSRCKASPGHADTSSDGDRSLYLSPCPQVRAFAAPVEICKKRLSVQYADPLDEVQASGLFDAGWYLENYIDLQNQRIEPLEHYWRNGLEQGRDPGPGFSTTGYLAKYPEIQLSGQHPLMDYLRDGQAAGRDPCPVLDGEIRRDPARQTVLLVGHIAGQRLYGAERSLLDVARAVRRLGYNLVVCLPGAMNQPYCDALRAESVAVKVMPYGWWQTGKIPCAVTVEMFQSVMKAFKVDLVHVNTLVLDEPLIAARQAGVPCLVHVRELPEHDEHLCRTLNATPQQLLRRVRSLADYVVANSMSVMQWLSSDSPVSGDAAQSGFSDSRQIAVVPNTIEMDALLALPLPGSASAQDLAYPHQTFTVGMVSSNLPKKGLSDLVEMAHHLQQLSPAVRVLIAGPRTPELDQALATQASGDGPDNLIYAGYFESPEQALQQMDALVNLSHFQESFGRTVLEAMAAGRPAVVYDWGALPELVIDGKTGYVVPFKDTLAVAEKLISLAQSAQTRLAFGKAARARAIEGYHPNVLAQRLESVYRRVLSRT